MEGGRQEERGEPHPLVFRGGDGIARDWDGWARRGAGGDERFQA